MSEKYSKIYSLPASLYAQGAPVIIKTGAILVNNESHALIGQLKLHSISDKTVKLVTVELTCLDSLGRDLSSPITFHYLDLSVKRGMDFGTQTPIKIPNSATRSYTVKVLEVGFDDNTVWHNSEDEWKELPEQLEFPFKSKDPMMAIEGYKSFFGADAEWLVLEHDDLWHCACGAVNHQEEKQCYKCGAFLDKLEGIDDDALVREGIYVSASAQANSDRVFEIEKAIEKFSSISEYKDSARLVEASKERAAELRNRYQAKQNKRKKIIKISSLITGGLVLLALLVAFAIVPAIMYSTGNYGEYVKVYKLKKFTIPDGVTSIGDYEFAWCDNLTSVVIPDSVTSIGEEAFHDCTSLSSVEIPDSVTSIGSDAFSNCSKLTSVVIGDGVTSIGFAAFSDCSSLTSVVIPDSVTSIGVSAFNGCSSLTSVVIGDGVTSIGGSAFNDCSSLTSVEIPDSVTSIGDWTFSDCTSLTDIYYKGSEAEWQAIEIGKENYDLTYATLHYNYRASNISQGTNPGTRPGASKGLKYTSNGDGTCYVSGIGACTDKKIVIPEAYNGMTVTGIYNRAFSGCSSLTSVVIPDSVTSIGFSAFYDCSSLTSVVIGDSVTSIGDGAFAWCDSLTDVYYTGSKAEWQAIEIGIGNSDLTSATKHYNYVPEE